MQSSSNTHLSSCLTACSFSTHAKGSWLGLRVVSPSTQRTNVQAALQRTSGTGFVRTQVVSISTWAVASLTPADTSNTQATARDGHGHGTVTLMLRPQLLAVPPARRIGLPR